MKKTAAPRSTRPAAALRTAPAAQAVQAARGPGRPAGTSQGLFSRESIIATALNLARQVPLHELSIVRAAHELNVTPGLIHYYLKGRDALTSGVMNAFYRELVESWPELDGHWRRDLEAICMAVYNAHARYPGIAAYVLSHNKFRMVQAVQPGETDYGVLLFEKFTSAVRNMGFDAARTGVYAHLLNEFITGYAQATAAHRWPGEHARFLDSKLAELDRRQYPSAHFVSKTFSRLDGASAFETGLALFLNGLDLERRRYRAAAASRTGAKK
ncbi:MAG: TetR family transcriptional regulator [Ramlibacter sp.]|nr:TetR family transcriptional regulator [Ramlibacter sp.]